MNFFDPNSNFNIIKVHDIFNLFYDGNCIDRNFKDVSSLIDLKLLKKKYPHIFNELPKKYNQKDLAQLFCYSFGSDQFLSDVTNNKPVIKITLQNKKNQYIYLKELIKNTICETLDNKVYEFVILGHFLIYISSVLWQAGSIAIWDTRKSSFIFFFESVNFCVYNFIHYNHQKDEFRGKFCYETPLSYVKGHGDFIITKERKLKTLKYEYTDGKNKSHSGIGKFFENEE